MLNRRSFVASVAGATLALPPFRADAIAQVLQASEVAGRRAPGDVADDEEYWSHIQRAFDTDNAGLDCTERDEAVWECLMHPDEPSQVKCSASHTASCLAMCTPAADAQ